LTPTKRLLNFNETIFSSIQVQKSSGNNATESNINRLAGLGIKISRSEEG